MNVGDKIFVYGTLRPDRSAGGTMKRGAEHIRTTSIIGSLYNLGWFPGVKLSGSDKIEGDLFEIKDTDLPAILDTYEGYPNLYDRTIVETECGEKTWVYTYNGDVSEDSRIPSGKWE